MKYQTINLVTPKKQKYQHRKHNTISITSYRKYSKELLLERLRKKNLLDYSTFNCIDGAYTDLMAALQDIVN